MLQRMRQAQGWMIKGVLWAVVMAFVVTIFYSWGMKSSSGPTRSEVAKIFGEPIERREFQQVQNQLYQNFRNRFRQLPNFDLREQFNFREMALEQIANRHILRRIAQENGLMVTNKELNDYVHAIPTFQAQGRFDTARYHGFLQSRVPPTPPQQFEEDIRQELLFEKVRDLIREAVQVTDTEVEQTYRWERERVAVRYVVLVPSLFVSNVQIIEKDVQAHYDVHQDAYREPERRSIQYVTISPARFRPTGQVPEDEIADYYAMHQEAFRRQERVNARHILFKVSQGAAPEQEAEIRTKAENVLAELRGGADFAMLARRHSEDTATAEKGGDLGSFPRGQMVKPFEEAAFALPVGEISDPVRTPFGYHIIRVGDKIEAGVKPLVEVRQDVISKVQEEKARKAALAFVDDLMATLEDDPAQFVPLAKQHELSVISTSFVASTERVPDLDDIPDMGRRIFALVGQAVDAVERSDGTHHIFQVAEVRPSTIPEFAAVESRVKDDLQRQKSAELAKQTADDWAAQIQAGASLSDLAAQLQVQVSETELFARNDPVPQVGRQAAFNQTAFELRTGEAGAAHTGSRHFVILVTKRQVADMHAYDTEKTTYRSQLLRRKQQQALLAFQNSLQARYQKLRQEGEIIVNPQYVF